MFHYILFFGFLPLSVVIADPGPPQVDPNTYVPQSPPSYNYYGHRQAQSQQQLETPSPYINKRNPNSNIYSDSQPLHSSPASPYGNTPRRSSANQCKLHINCPSKKTKATKVYLFIYLRCKKSSYT
jgi:hypothetical protein